MKISDKYDELSRLKDDYREVYNGINGEINKLNTISIPNGDVIIQETKLKSGLSKTREATNAIIDCYEDILTMNELEIESLEEEIGEMKHELGNANGNYLIGNYDELKRVLEIRGVWNEKLEDIMENIVRFNNVIE